MEDVAAAYLECRGCPDSNYTVSVDAAVCTLRRVGLAAQINPQKIPPESRMGGGSYQCSSDLSDKSCFPHEESVRAPSSIFTIKNSSKCK